MSLTVATIILNWNQADDTLACVRAVEALPLAPERIWVVDNGSAPGDVERIRRECSGVRLIFSETNKGFAGGNNLALVEILRAGYDAVLLLNNDATVDAASLEHLCATLRNHPAVGIVGPMLWDADQPDRLLAAGGRDIAHHLSSHLHEPVRWGELREVDYVPGTCVLIRAQMLRLTGLLDEDFFFGGEVAALCKAGRALGYGCVVDGCARANHSIRRSSKIRRSLHAYYVMRNRFLFIRRFYARKKIALYLLWTAYAVYNGLLATIQRDSRHAKAIWQGCLDGWLGRVGNQNARVTGGQIS